MREKRRLFADTVVEEDDSSSSKNPSDFDTSGLSAVLGHHYQSQNQQLSQSSEPVRKKRKTKKQKAFADAAPLRIERATSSSTIKKKGRAKVDDNEEKREHEDTYGLDLEDLPLPASENYPPISQEETNHRNRNVSEPVIHNAVGKFTLAGFNLDVDVLAWFICGNRDRNGFSAPVCLHSKDPVFTALIFQNGSCVIPGARSEAGVVLAAYSLASFLEDISGSYFPPENISVTNIMCTVYLGYTVDHLAMHEAHSQSMLRKGLFNLLKFPVKDKEMVLISPGGALVICGTASREGVYRIRNMILPLVARFMVKDQGRKQLEEEKKQRGEAYRLIQSRERFVKKKARVKAALTSGTRNKYAKVSPAQLQAMTDIAEVVIQERCYPPRPPNHPECAHYVNIRYADQDKLVCVGKMPRPMIIRLCEQNQLTPDPHLLVPFRS